MTTMQKRSKKKAVLAAITAAVTKYIQTQDENFAPAMEMSPARLAPAGVVSLYGASGRLEMMDSRRLLSLRMGRR
jgi:hypothetical protein